MRPALASLFFALQSPSLNMTDPNCSKIKQEIHLVFETWETAWNSGSVEGYCQAYLESSRTRYVGNETILGHDAICQHFRERGVKGSLSSNLVDINVITPDSALVYGEYRLVVEQETFQGVFTVMLERSDKGWKILADHSSAR